MHRLFYPCLYVASIFDIDLDDLERRGIKNIIFDLDNTIIERGAPEFPAKVMRWLNAVQQRGIRIAIVSNNRTRTAERMAGEAGIPAVFNAIKPRRSPFKKVLRMLKARPDETAVVGDQIFTDVVGGNRLGMYTILTKPMKGKEFIATTLITRQLERLFLPRIRKRVGLYRRPTHD